MNGTTFSNIYITIFFLVLKILKSPKLPHEQQALGWARHTYFTYTEFTDELQQWKNAMYPHMEKWQELQNDKSSSAIL